MRPPFFKITFLFFLSFLTAGLFASPSKPPELPKTTRGITLQEAIDLALDSHPSLRASSWNVEAKRGAARQSGALPNPSLIVESEEFSGSGALSGTGAMELSLGLSQTLPLGGKVGKSRRVADAETKMAEAERADLIVELRSTVMKRYYRVALLQERLALERENREIALKLLGIAKTRADSGEISPVDLSRIEVESTRAEIEEERLQGEFKGALSALAACWVSPAQLLSGVEPLQALPLVPEESALRERFLRSPTLLLAERETAKERASLSLAKAQVWPDLEISGGWKKHNETGEHALFAGISLPIPLFHRNRGGVQEARANLERAAAAQDSRLKERESLLNECFARATSLSGSLSKADKSLLPAAENAFRGALRGYQLGEKSLLELLEARRTLLECRKERMDLAEGYLETLGDLELLAPSLSQNPKEIQR